MRTFFVLFLLLLLPAFAADTDIAGKHAGEWKSSSSDVGGPIRFTLEGAAGGAWKCELSFGLNGADVKTTMKTVKVEGSKIELLYDFDAGGMTLTSHVTGEWNGSGFKGSYDTTGGGVPVDSGSWSASKAK